MSEKEEKKDVEEKETVKNKEAKKEQKNDKTKQKNSKMKIILIVVISVIVIIGAAVGGYFAYQYTELKKPLEEEWGETYYLYIKDSIISEENANTQKDTGITRELQDSKITFCQIEDVQDPVMVLSYNSDGDEFSNIYYINDNQVNYIKSETPSTVEVLYDIETKKYGWYIHTSTETEDTYKPVAEQISYTINNLEKTNTDQNVIDNTNTTNNEVATTDSATNQVTALTFKKGEVTTVETVEGETLSIQKFDEKFIKTDIAENNKVDFNTNLKEKELKELISTTVKDYKTQDQLVTEEIKSEVANKETEITNKKSEMQAAEEEKKKQEEAMKITQDNVMSKVGEHLKYFASAYLGRDYGLYKLYTIKDVTEAVKIPGSPEFAMTEEVVGLKSIQTLKDAMSKYMSNEVITKVNNSQGNPLTDLTEYNGKVYVVRGGIGDGPDINYKTAKVLTSEGDTSTIRLDEINSLTGSLDETITVTVKYDKASSTYKITGYSVK